MSHSHNPPPDLLAQPVDLPHCTSAGKCNRSRLCAARRPHAASHTRPLEPHCPCRLSIAFSTPRLAKFPWPHAKETTSDSSSRSMQRFSRPLPAAARLRSHVSDISNHAANLRALIGIWCHAGQCCADAATIVSSLSSCSDQVRLKRSGYVHRSPFKEAAHQSHPLGRVLTRVHPSFRKAFQSIEQIFPSSNATVFQLHRTPAIASSEVTVTILMSLNNSKTSFVGCSSQTTRLT